jgi:hypothetical protein
MRLPVKNQAEVNRLIRLAVDITFTLAEYGISDLIGQDTIGASALSEEERQARQAKVRQVLQEMRVKENL